MCITVVDAVKYLPHLNMYLTINVKNFLQLLTKQHNDAEQMNVVIFFDNFQVVFRAVIWCTSYIY